MTDVGTYARDPDSTLDYSIDWSAWLIGADKIATSTWSVPAGLTKVSESLSPAGAATTTTVFVSGGLIGATYVLLNRVTTVDGRTDERTIRIIIRDSTGISATGGVVFPYATTAQVEAVQTAAATDATTKVNAERDRAIAAEALKADLAGANTRVAGYVTDPGPTKDALSATFAPRWKASTAYALGDTVLAPDGSLVKAKVAFTSGTSYTAANWRSVATAAGTQAATELSSAALSRNRSGGRGRIAIELDDSLAAHFTDILPVSVEMGFSIGAGWITSDGRDAEIADAYAKGWEIISHSHTHPAGGIAGFTEAQLVAEAVQSRAAIAAITGDPDNIAFIYPEHARNANTDRVLSRYFTWGRGLASAMVSSKGGHPWLVSAYFLDPTHDANGNLSGKFKDDLRVLAHTDGAAALYGHYNRTDPGWLPALINLVNFARSLGIQIVRPSELRGTTNVVSRGIVPADWAMGVQTEVSNEQVIRDGESAFKITPRAVGGGFLTTSITRQSTKQFPIAPTPGMFGIYRASVRYKASAPVTVSNNFGFQFGVGLFARVVNGGAEVAIYGGLPYVSQKFPALGTTAIPAADWGLISNVVAFGPDVVGIAPVLAFANIAEGGVPIYVTDVRFDRIDTVAALHYDVTLNGTAGATVKTNALGVNRCGVSLTAKASTAGRLWCSTPGTQGDEVIVYSTDATDTTQAVRVTVTPGIGYKDYTLVTTGA